MDEMVYQVNVLLKYNKKVFSKSIHSQDIIDKTK